MKPFMVSECEQEIVRAGRGVICISINSPFFLIFHDGSVRVVSGPTDHQPKSMTKREPNVGTK